MNFAALSAVSLAALMAAGPALAQTPPDPVSQLDEIVVTGEKIDRSLQDTTTSVAVTTERRLQDEGIIGLQEVYDRTANMSQTYGSAGFTIRGVAAQGVSGAGDAPLTTVYVDGAPLPTGILFNGPTDAWDVSQIEILRGPQSTLQGLNALAGAVIVRTEDPTQAWGLRARAIMAHPKETGLAIAGGGPLIEDELAFRLSADSRQGDGFIHNAIRNEPEDPVDRVTIRGKLLWTPSALRGLEARLGYTHFESDGGYQFSYVYTDAPDFYDNRTARNDARNGSNIDADLWGVEVSYPLNETLTFTSATSFSDVSQFMEYDNDGTAASIGYGTSDRQYDTLTQEFRLNYQGGGIRGLVGGFYYNQDQQSYTVMRVDVPTPVETISQLLQSSGLNDATADFIAGLYATALPVIPVDYTGDFPSSVETYALFGDGEWDLTDRLSLVGGFRWDREENDIEVSQTAEFVGAYPNPDHYGAPGSPLWLAITGINAGVEGLVSQAASSTPPANRQFDAFLPKLGVRYDLTEDMTLGFVLQRGYRSGGSSANTARAQVFAYEPEYTWNYEGSLRSIWLGGDLTVNANAYYVDWTDQQVSVNFGLNLYDSHTVNAGKSHLYGFEVEAAWRATDALDVYGAVGHARTKFDQFGTAIGAQSDLSGQEFAFAPALTLSAGGNYRWGEGFVVNVNANYRSEVFSDVGTAQTASRVASRTLFNTKGGYETERWGLYAYAHNLFNEGYITYNRGASGQAVVGDPRVVGVMLQANW